MNPVPRYLVLEARFLVGTYGGVEWPPSPFRLLQAMVAGVRGTELPGLVWLEAQPAPLIQAEPEPAVTRFQRSVPNNANPAKSDALSTLRDVAIRRPSHAVSYLYPLQGDEDPEWLSALHTVAHAVHTLGTGEDMCAVSIHVLDALAPTPAGLCLWVPHSRVGAMRQAGERLLRVPAAGSLASLQARHLEAQHRLDSSRTGYGRPVLAPGHHGLVAYRLAADVPRTALLPLRLVSPADPQAPARFHPAQAVVVAGMLRHATMQLAASGPLADFAAGYGPAADPDHRLSWLPLPSVGHAHSDGRVRRALVCCRAQDWQALSQLWGQAPDPGVPLVDAHSGETRAWAQTITDESDPVLHHYLRAATRWHTVTPMIMPGEHAHNQRLLNRLLLKALRESGINPSLLLHAEFSPHPWTAQGVALRDLKLKDWQAKRLILQHVRMQFREPVPGPVVLGRGRHYGVGLCAADPE